MRNNSRDFPWTTRYLTTFATHHCGIVGFSTLGLANAQLGLHRDAHNSKTSRNYVLPLQLFKDGSLWVQNDEVDEAAKVVKTLPKGKSLYGKIVEMMVVIPVDFSPRGWHEIQP